MAIDFTSLSIEQALRMALKSEFDAADVYKKLNGMIQNFVLKDKLEFLIDEESKHQRVIESLYQKLFDDKVPEIGEKSLMPRLRLALDEESSVLDLLELAMEAEKVSEEFYDRLSEEVEDRGAQVILQYLSSMEHGHYALLKGEYELCMRDEAYYQRDDFQYDMVHIGP